MSRSEREIRVSCSNQNGPLTGCRVTLNDESGAEQFCAFTDRHGLAVLRAPQPGNYQVRAFASASHSPAAQSRWFRFFAQSRFECGFWFQRIPFYQG